MSAAGSLLSFSLIAVVCAYDCQSGFNFTFQPPQVLNCNPTGQLVGLFCSTSPSGSFNWYHTLDPAQAGISGDLIINNGNPYTLDSIFGSNSLLTFTVSNNTIGFYWCVITSYTPIPLRPSTITPICMNYNNSLSECPQSFSLNEQHRTISECADENVSFTRAHLPTNCIPYQSLSYTLHLNTSTSVHNILTSIVPTTTAAGISSVSLFSSTSFIKQFSFTASSTQVPTAVDDDNKVIIFVSTGLFVILITVSVILFVIICSICYCRVHQSQELDDIAESTTTALPVLYHRPQAFNEHMSTKSATKTIQSTADSEPDIHMKRNSAYITKTEASKVLHESGIIRCVSLSSSIYTPRVIKSSTSSSQSSHISIT